MFGVLRQVCPVAEVVLKVVHILHPKFKMSIELHLRVLPNTPQSQNEIRRSSSYERRTKRLGRPNILSVFLSRVSSLFGKK